MTDYQPTLTGAVTESTDPFALDTYDWQRADADTDALTHDISDYPAQYPPEIPSQLLHHFRTTDAIPSDGLIVDPFTGGGTTAVEARLHELDFFGTDINPFACWLARTKANPLSGDRIWTAALDILDDWHIHRRFVDQGYAMDNDAGYTAVDSHWFPEPQIQKLELMAHLFIEARAHYGHQVIRFLQITLGQTARAISYQQPGEFKRQRIPEAERAGHDPNFEATFWELLDKNVESMREYAAQAPTDPDTTIKLIDCRDPTLLDVDAADAIITSPPYGDHATTVGYGQFSREQMVAATPFDNERMKEVDKIALGGRDSDHTLDFETVTTWSPSLAKTVNSLAAVDGRNVKSGEETTIPIPRSDTGVEELLGRLEADREQVEATDIEALEAEIDDAVYDLFELTEEERAIVDDYLEVF